jgi:serine/threonine protein kinase
MLSRADIEKGRAMMTQESMLARYTVLHELGRGAMGVVYAARDQATGTVVALKTLDPELLKKSDHFAGRFLKHAGSARPLSHRNIVKIHDAGEAGGRVYVAMEMLEGESLRKILDSGPLPIARAIQIARDIACGLAYAHLEGVVHGGLKPSNIIILRSGVVKITDFGIAQLGQAALLSGARAGCLSYMSPEQVRGDPIDHRCDIFSLGALFYEMLTQRAPFEGESPKKIIEKILHAKPPLPSALNEHVPRAIDGIISSMLAEQPASRMPGVPILLRDLQRLEEGLGLGSGANAGRPEPTASVPPPAGPEPSVPKPEPDRFRDRVPMQDNPRFARNGEARAASGPRIRADSSAAEEFQHRSRTPDREAFDYHKALIMMERESRRERSSAPRPAVFATLALVAALVGVAVAVFMYYSPSPSQRVIAASRTQDAPATTLGAPQASLPRAMSDGEAEHESLGASSTPNPKPPKPLEAEPTPWAHTGSLAAPASGEPSERGIAASRVQEAPAIALDAPQASPPRPVGDGQAEEESIGLSAPKPMPPKPLAGEPTPMPQTETLVARASEQAAPAGAAPAQDLPRAVQTTPKVPEQRPRSTARLILAVAPRGEVYINGKHYGTTPPITTLDLDPGMYRIEVRSGSRKPYLTYMTVEAGDVRRVRHTFNAIGAAQPPKSASWENSNRAAR